MITRLYSLLDRAAAAFGGPIVAVNDVMAKRSLAEFLLDDRQSNLSRYPDEFDLYWIGSMDSSTGVVTAAQPTLVCRISELLPNKGDVK